MHTDRERMHTVDSYKTTVSDDRRDITRLILSSSEHMSLHLTNIDSINRPTLTTQKRKMLI